jgi:hypothetical protein
MLLLGGACLLLLAVGLGSMSEPRGFDADRWRQGQGCTPDNPRLGMYGELRTKLLLERPTDTGVVAMLGTPDAGRGPGSVSYMLGYNIIDCDMVSIHFGPDGRVSEVRYVQG